MKRTTTLIISIGVMLILGVLILVNRSADIFQARSWLGYLLYGIFIASSILAIISIVMTFFSQNKTRKKAEENKDKKLPD